MAKRACWIFVVSGVALLPAPVSAVTVDFDTVGCGSECAIADGYAGLAWDNFFVLDTATYPTPDSGYNRGVVSGTFVGFNGSAAPASFSSAAPINFVGVYLTAAWNVGLNVTVVGLLGGTPLYSQTVVVDDQTPTLFRFDYLGVDEVRFTSFGGVDAGTPGAGEHFAMDDMTYEPVPEPSTLLLLGTGMLAAARRTRSRRGYPVVK